MAATDVRRYVITSTFGRKAAIDTCDPAEAWTEVEAIVSHGGKATVEIAKPKTCVRHYPPGHPEVCECDHEIDTYQSRSGTRCWCCFGKVA